MHEGPAASAPPRCRLRHQAANSHTGASLHMRYRCCSAGRKQSGGTSCMSKPAAHAQTAAVWRRGTPMLPAQWSREAAATLGDPATPNGPP